MQEQASVVVASALGLLQQSLRFHGKLGVAKDLLREAQTSHIRFLLALPRESSGWYGYRRCQCSQIDGESEEWRKRSKLRGKSQVHYSTSRSSGLRAGNNEVLGTRFTTCRLCRTWRKWSRGQEGKYIKVLYRISLYPMGATSRPTILL